ncbi:MAG: nucleoside recognition domain-containing protein [Bacteroidota bacterium]
MTLNYIWISFFFIAFLSGIFQWIFLGNIEIFPALVKSIFDNAKTGFELSLFLSGILTLWMGIMKIGENGGIVSILQKGIGPFFYKLFPEVPKNHPAFTPMVMNVASNMLGLDNAATPMGLKAMNELQDLNPNKDVASNAQIMFLVLNTSGLTILPTTIMAYRYQFGAVDPSDIFLPTLIATFFSTLAGLLAVSFYQKINLLDKTILLYLGALTVLIVSLIAFISNLPQEAVSVYSSAISNLILFSIIVYFILLCMLKKANVYESFIEGAKEGFGVAIKIIPYLVAMLVAIGVFRTCGALTFITEGIGILLSMSGIDTQFVDALPTALMKPLSGSGARGMMVDVLENNGPDSLSGRIASIMQGSTETTLYVVAVYFGAVNIKRSRYAITCGLIADAVGVVAAILLGYLFFA